MKSLMLCVGLLLASLGFGQTTIWQTPGQMNGTVGLAQANEEMIWLFAPGVETQSSGIELRVTQQDTVNKTAISVYDENGASVASTYPQPFPNTGYVFIPWQTGTLTLPVGVGSSRYHLGAESGGRVVMFGSVVSPSPVCDVRVGSIVDGVALTSIRVPADYEVSSCAMPWFRLKYIAP